LFGYTVDDLDPRIPPARIHGGADHLVLGLKSRAALAAMHYDLHGGHIDIVQGEDMGMRSRLRADISPVPASSIRVSGTARIMQS
jgi:predicted PhzF superfamily epimerase YddE/YHI9